ncbi:hypothetical protein CLU96_3291 [Chryseobacterium sp. 52]|nr:hypothetical protein CLU96_3291 [Chryseobacterium sp. 52]
MLTLLFFIATTFVRFLCSEYIKQKGKLKAKYGVRFLVKKLMKTYFSFSNIF